MAQQQQDFNETIGRIKRDTPIATPPLPIIGNIRIGEKRQPQGGGKEYPVSLDYFKPTGDFAKLFTDAYGAKPNKIQVIFISNDNVQSCHEEYDARDAAGRRAGYGDGETFYLYDLKKEEYIKYEPNKIPADKEFMTKYTKDNKLVWKVVLTLHFIIPKIKGVFGVWRFQTRGSKSSIQQIISAFDMIKNSAGTIVNIPFDMVVEKVKSQKPENKSVFPVVKLIPNITQDNLDIVRGFLQHGGNVMQIGMLTDEKIKEIPKQTLLLTENKDQKNEQH